MSEHRVQHLTGKTIEETTSLKINFKV